LVVLDVVFCAEVFNYKFLSALCRAIVLS
jgi:hypothetical protein